MNVTKKRCTRTMSQPLAIPPPGLDELTAEERVEYAQRLWDRVATNLNNLPAEDWQIDLAKERLGEHRANPGSAVEWSEIYGRLRKRFEPR